MQAGKQGTGKFTVPSDVDQATAYCNSSSHVWARSNNGDARRIKVNGKVRRWKRDPARIEIPFKYGLYEYGTITNINDILIPV